MPNVTKICEACRIEFSGPRFSFKDRKYCSHTCYAKQNRTDLIGLRVGRLTVVEHVGGKKWKSLCDCGKYTVSPGQNLRNGRALSCGCRAREIWAANRRTHGLSNTPTHNSWDGMIQRCTNPNFKQFKDYGGRGITLDPRWRAFEAFLADMGEKPEGMTLERKDNNQGYSKGNCEWAPRKTQQRNRRCNRYVTYEGATYCFAEWCERLGRHVGSARSRLQQGWTDLEALGLVPRA